MGANSIKANMSKEDIIATIRLSLSSDFEKESMHLVLEGDDDTKFFERKVTNNVEIYESFSGKLGVIEIVSTFGDKRVIGICDKDYDEDVFERVFNYDFSCLEMMLVASPDVFNSIHCLINNGQFDDRELLHKMLSSLKPISLLRRRSKKETLNFRFNGLRLSCIFETTSKEFNFMQIATQLEALNPEKTMINDYLKAVIEESEVGLSTEDLLNITNGHDFRCCMKLYCDCKIPKRKLNEDAIFWSLLCAYRMNDFFKTDLFRKLVEYETSEKICIINHKSLLKI